MELGLLRLAIALYLASTVAALVGIAVRQDLPRTLLPRLRWAGFVAHGLSIAVRSWTAGHMAVTTFDEALSFLALLLVAVFLVVQLRRPLVALGAVVSPLAFGLTLAADAVYRGARPLPPVLASAWVPIHVVLWALVDAGCPPALGVGCLGAAGPRRACARKPRDGVLTLCSAVASWSGSTTAPRRSRCASGWRSRTGASSPRSAGWWRSRAWPRAPSSPPATGWRWWPADPIPRPSAPRCPASSRASTACPSPRSPGTSTPTGPA